VAEARFQGLLLANICEIVPLICVLSVVRIGVAIPWNYRECRKPEIPIELRRSIEEAIPNK
jgi:hypothetical protein